MIIDVGKTRSLNYLPHLRMISRKQLWFQFFGGFEDFSMYSSLTFPPQTTTAIGNELGNFGFQTHSLHLRILWYILRERRDLHFHLTIWVLCNFLDQLLPTRPAEPPHEPRHHGCGRGPRCHRHGRCSQCGSWQGCRSSLRGLEKHQFLELLLDRP